MYIDERTPGHCIVPDRAAERILMLPAAGDGWMLPTVRVNEEWWSPNWLARITGQVHRQLGVSATVLRHVQGPPLWTLELETHGPERGAPAGARWASRAELDGLPLAVPGLRSPLEAWFADVESGQVPQQRAPWQRRGWFSEALRWIEEQLGHAGLRRAGPVQQLKGAWHISCVLRVPTERGDLYFKADRCLPSCEATLVAALSARWSQRVPGIVAMDADRCWMLVRDFGPHVLEPDYDRPMSPHAHWEGAARGFAQLQVDAAAHVDEWLALGCPDWRGLELAQRFESLTRDDAALRRGEPDGLSAGEAAQLRRLLPHIYGLCEELASSGVPDSLVHLDCSGRNVVLANGGYVFYDWSDAAVGHPFLSGTNLVRDVRYPIEAPIVGPSSVPSLLACSDTARQRFVRDAYLEPWARCAPATRLRAAFDIVATLWPVWRAVRTHRELPHLEPHSHLPWTIDVGHSVPAAVREVGSVRLHR